uniref:Uncharacterized protein n=1 Tax=Anas platyrhynchos platyrhynchos TaxID=8840 RepID=A0A493TZZ2_ANAPP
AVTPTRGEQQEEIGAAAKQLPGQRAGRGPADGVVGAADAQHGHGHLVGVPQGLVALPVGFPAGGGPAEEGFLQLPQRAAAQQLGHVHRLGQGVLPDHRWWWVGGCQELLQETETRPAGPRPGAPPQCRRAPQAPLQVLGQR